MTWSESSPILPLLFNGVFILEVSTPLNELPPLRVTLNLPASTINQMIRGELEPELGCTLEASNNNLPKRNVKLVMEGFFSSGDDVRLPISRQVAKTNKNGVARYDLTFPMIQYLALLVIEPGPRQTSIELSGRFKGKKPVEEYSFSCELEGRS